MATRIVFASFLAAGLFLPQESLLAGSRATLPNAVDLELGGKCFIWSMSYQRMVAEPFGVEVGASLLGGSGSESVTFFTFGGKFYFAQGNVSPYIGGGAVILTASTGSGPFDLSGSATLGYVTVGFEYRSEGGFVGRGGIYALIYNGEYGVWPGLTIGYAF